MLSFITRSHSIRVTILLFLKEPWSLGPAPSTSIHSGCSTRLTCRQVSRLVIRSFCNLCTIFHIPSYLFPRPVGIPILKSDYNSTLSNLDFQRNSSFQEQQQLTRQPKIKCCRSKLLIHHELRNYCILVLKAILSCAHGSYSGITDQQEIQLWRLNNHKQCSLSYLAAEELTSLGSKMNVLQFNPSYLVAESWNFVSEPKFKSTTHHYMNTSSIRMICLDGIFNFIAVYNILDKTLEDCSLRIQYRGTSGSNHS